MKELKFKKIKFKNNELTLKQYNKIVYKGMTEGLYTESRPTDYQTPKVKKKRTYRTFYKGELKNNKAQGWGIEVCQYRESFGHSGISEYYEGEWSNGKREGYGEVYDHHPKIGPVDTRSDYAEMISTNLKLEITNNAYTSFYKGYWKNGRRNGKGKYLSFYTMQEGEFKDNALWNGIGKLFSEAMFSKKKVGTIAVYTFKNGKRLKKIKNIKLPKSKGDQSPFTG